MFCTDQNAWRCWLTTLCVNVMKLRMESIVICMTACTESYILNVNFVKLYTTFLFPFYCLVTMRCEWGLPLYSSLLLERRITKCLSK